MTKEDKFVNLHLHTHYSTGDSVIKIPDLYTAVENAGQSAVAVTDHGSTEGWSELYNVFYHSNIKPIFGNEFYCKTTMIKPKNRTRFHLVVLAENDKGAIDIQHMQDTSARQHFYYKPLLPYPVLFNNYDKNLFISTACSLGTIGQGVNPNNTEVSYRDAENFIISLLDHFGKEHVALEFQFHPEYKDQATINERLLKIYDAYDVKYCIATCDSHFIDDPKIRDMIICDAWHTTLKDLEESGRSTLKSNCLGTSDKIKFFAAESGFSDLDLVDVMINNTQKIAEKCNVGHINNIGAERVLPPFTKHKEFKNIFLKEPRRIEND